MSVYDSAGSSEQVDQITAKRIQELHGSAADELGNHRKALLAMFVLMRKQSIPGLSVAEATQLGDELLAINTLTENIVKEGREYKRSKGW